MRLPKKKKNFLRQKFGTVFFRGLAATLPAVITIAIVVWLFSVLEDTFRPPIQDLIGEYYFPGLGIIIAFIIIFFIGVIINNWLIRKLYNFGEKLFRRIPLIKTVYNAIYDVMAFFSKEHQEEMGKVVILEINSWKTLGFVTRETFDDIPYSPKDEVAVYVPFSYQIGGFTYFVPKSKVTPVDMSVEQAMRFVVTAGLLRDHQEERKK